jgi:hypothetical protein
VAGLVLELLGILIVAIGIIDIRAEFKLNSFYASAIDWFNRSPIFKGKNQEPIYGCAQVTDEDDVMVATGASSCAVPSTLEGRVALLEERLRLAEIQINEGGRRLEEETKSRVEAMNSEEAARVEGDAVIRKQLEDAVVGGINLETVGIVWLAFGVTLSSLSEELACLVAGFM